MMSPKLPDPRSTDMTEHPHGAEWRDARQASLEAIAGQAKQAMGCVAAFICFIADGVLVVVAESHDGPLSGVLPCLTGKGTANPISLLIEGSPTEISFIGEFAEDVRFATAIQTPGRNAAVLMVLDIHYRSHVSAAQTYVLEAHASHLTTVLELASLQKRVVDDVNVTTNAKMERLRLLESVAVHARDSIIITEAEPIDLPGPRIIYCNAAFTQTTGYSAEEVIGKTPRLLQGSRTDATSRKRLRSALSAWEPIEIEMINYRKDGTEFWVELSIVPVANERGWYTHWVSVQRDITERKMTEELTARVRVAEIENQALATEILERRRIEAALQYAAFHDSLTRLRNREFFMERLTKALARGLTPAEGTCAVLFLDLDRFKIVNDSLGHLEGDALLKDIAIRLKRCVRPEDTLARIGGDEFAILIENAQDLTVPVQIAEAVIEALRAPVQLSKQAVFPSCSIGIVHVTEKGATPEDLMRNADIAMYEAKRAGFGDYAIFDSSMHDDAVARLALQTDLRRAVERKEFHVAYQAIVDPTNEAVLSFEALLRWDHPVHGGVRPLNFISVAEEIGLIRQIDRWVMRTACEQLASWQQLFASPNLRMSINVSASEFADPDFVDHLSATLCEFGLLPKSLELEITEGIFLHPSPGVAETISKVRDTGVRIALDDFGTGYSSLSYINRYPIDTIKIDKSFIDDVGNNPQTLAIVELIVKLGRVLNLSIVAEGVETQEQAEILSGIGCRAIQGYRFSRPISAADVKVMLRGEGQQLMLIRQ